MLAYVFVHRPSAGTEPSLYLSRLRAFHDALAIAPPSGFLRSWVWSVSDGPLGEALEDWYLVENWAALGVLNDAAVTGKRQVPHDQVAPLSGTGAGAVYRLIHGAPLPAGRRRVRVSKPAGTHYEEYEGQLRRAAGTGTIWKRQMVLGPDAEFLIDSSDSTVSESFDPQSVSTLALVSAPASAP
jgi:hypothetical protein